MIIFPAIDIRGGRCVRLVQGRADQETVYGDDPAAMGQRWQAAGAAWLHVVDLDGAFGAAPKNLEATPAVCAGLWPSPFSSGAASEASTLWPPTLTPASTASSWGPRS